MTKIDSTFAAIAAAALAVCNAAAADYPVRPIRMIVPQAPGSASDNVARLVAAALVPQLKQQIVVDNRPGGALAISPNLAPHVPFDVLKDFQAVVQIAYNQMLLAATLSLPVKSVRELIDYAKRNPGKLSNASSGNGTPTPIDLRSLIDMPWRTRKL